MPHVTFVHGICNQPEKTQLLRNWNQSLSEGGLDLAGAGVSTSMVYWADVMYPEPLAAGDSFEAVEGGLGTADVDEDLAWIDELQGNEKALVESMRRSLGVDSASPDGDDFKPEAPDENVSKLEFEAIPLPWFIKRRVMKAFLRDVHHYLFDATSSPRPGESFRVKEHIRDLFVSQLSIDSQNEGPHVVVSHSMGTVISYDCLKNVPACPAIDGYMTVGSPLGLSEVHDNYDPRYNAKDAFPSVGVSGDWINVYDRLDPVAFNARIADDYLKSGTEVVQDHRVTNGGAWRHSSLKYFAQESLCEHLANLLEL
jgi:hypothetical protein